MPELFEQPSDEFATHQPLAARMRPRALDEFVGQEHILGPDGILRAAIEKDDFTSMIFWGPAGCGKSTLAFVIARKTNCRFESYSAVTSGVPEIRKVIQRAREQARLDGRRTILFIDELHRFNKAQQDALLPHVEDGTIILIGATTENPYFEVNSPLMSRCRLFRFEPLTDDHVRTLVLRSLSDEERGLGREQVKLEDEALDHLVDVSQGDARGALTALELAFKTTEPDPKTGVKAVTKEIAEQAVQKRVLDYDKSGDKHYDTISAFIKSMRGSDPDAAVYWLARMLAAGEDPKFIARRIVIQAAEDIGNADPMALTIATAAAHAVEFVGMPEAQIPLAQAAIYLACAPKSNASYVAINRANKDVAERKGPPVPKHLRDSAYPGAKALGHGNGYLYPHDHPGHYVEQEYLPPGAKSEPYYEPTDHGHEAKFKQRFERLRRKPDDKEDDDD
ncbi:MAG: AAA family ATPase [Armatimonadetes bacterium RBG_16_58_9]|nr:MAG: AAA family ATPase [Armatimonadetes bacterium RBG_16_58_9]